MGPPGCWGRGKIIREDVSGDCGETGRPDRPGVRVGRGVRPPRSARTPGTGQGARVEPERAGPGGRRAEEGKELTGQRTRGSAGLSRRRGRRDGGPHRDPRGNLTARRPRARPVGGHGRRGRDSGSSARTGRGRDGGPGRTVDPNAATRRRPAGPGRGGAASAAPRRGAGTGRPGGARRGRELVDTAGVAGLGAVRSLATIDPLPTADAVVVVTDATQEFTAPEMALLRQAVALCPNVVCVVTRTDARPEWRRIVSLNRGHLAAAGVEPRVFRSPPRSRSWPS